jgi:hypothetical protein
MEINMTLNLTPKQQLFCDEYLVDLNATRAALRAGYSAGTALNGSLMRLPKIRLYLDEKMGEAAQKAQITKDMVLAELYKIAFGNMGNYFDEHGCIKPMHLLSEDAKAALWSTSVSDTGSGGTAAAVTKFRLYNKLTALDKIAKHLNLYKPEVKEAKVKYVYLDRDSLTADDRFEDKTVKKPRNSSLKPEDGSLKREENSLKPKENSLKPEAGSLKREENSLKPEAGSGKRDENLREEYEVLQADDDEILVDGAGIPYGHVRVPNPDNFIDLNETPEQLLARIGMKPPVAKPPKNNFSWGSKDRFNGNARGMIRRKPGEKWLLR